MALEAIQALGGNGYIQHPPGGAAFGLGNFRQRQKGARTQWQW
jgi:hypothetical protein